MKRIKNHKGHEGTQRRREKNGGRLFSFLTSCTLCPSWLIFFFFKGFENGT
jgi:hypothetical protein